MSKQFCRNGHDTLLVGRKPSGHCRRCHYERVKRYQKKNVYTAAWTKKADWKRKGINFTIELFRLMLVWQGRRCAVCKRHESEFKQALAVDHDHKTGKVRGLLCGICNRLVVKVVDDYSHLIPAAQKYVHRTQPHLV